MSFPLISFFVWNSGISTLITFLNCCFISKVFPVAINAVFNTCSFMPALATANSILAAFNPFSTFNLKSMFSFIKSINWRTSSSRLSFKSLWPLVADKSFFFCFVSSIRVGFTLVPAILYLAFQHYFSSNIQFNESTLPLLPPRSGSIKPTSLPWWTDGFQALSFKFEYCLKIYCWT